MFCIIAVATIQMKPGSAIDAKAVGIRPAKDLWIQVQWNFAEQILTLSWFYR